MQSVSYKSPVTWEIMANIVGSIMKNIMKK